MNKILLIALLIGATFSQNLNNDMIKTEINANDLPLLIPTETASVEIIQVDPIQVYLPPAPQDKASTDEQYIGTANIEILPGKEAYPETG